MNFRFDAMKLDRLNQIVSQYSEVRAAYLYGSAVAGKLRPNSDIDVALWLTDACADETADRILTHVLCEVEASFQREADVKILNRLESLPVMHEILANGILFIDREPVKRRAFAVRKNQEYLDFLPHYERILESYARKLRKNGAEKPGAGEDHFHSSKSGKDSHPSTTEPDGIRHIEAIATYRKL